MKYQASKWDPEFERMGEQVVWESFKPGAIYNDETKRQAGLRWHEEQGRKQRTRRQRMYLAALVGVGLTAIGVAVALFH